MTIAVVPFRREHLETFVPGEREAEAMAGADLERVARFWNGHAVSAMDGNTCLGIFGALDVDGAAFMSVLMSDDLRARPMALHRGIKRGIADLFRAGYEKITTSARESDADANAWLQRLGFEVSAKENGEVRYTLWKPQS